MQMKTSSRNGFTLIEIVLAITILALVMMSVFGVMQVGISATDSGQAAMEQYQSARIGLRQITEELRYALSPNSFWRPMDTFKDVPLEFAMTTFDRPMVEEEDPGAIRFMGASDSVLFVRKVYKLGQYPPFDLEECQIYVDSNNNLVLEVVRSLLTVKQASWFFQYEFKVNLNGIVFPGSGSSRVRFREIGDMEPMPLMEYIGDAGFIGRKHLIAERIKEIRFQYTDGEGWSGTWDSQQLIQQNRISPDSPNFNRLEHTQLIERGPPQIVEIEMELLNGDTLVTAIDIPAGNMQKQGIDLFVQEGAGYNK